MARLYLSPPHLGGAENELVSDAIASNWIAPLGPHVDAFEREVAARAGVKHAVAVASGTAAIHLALQILGVGPGDEVLCSSLTFIASAAPITYLGARPVFLDSEASGWNLDPALVEAELAACAARGRLPKAVVVVDLYGQSADYDPILAACDRYGVPVVADAAESLGATYRGRPSGARGRCAAFSFNGNKIITTSGGGMLVSDDAELINRARFLATQAREPAPHYEHQVVGYNYRMSNLLAAVGRAQLATLDQRITARRGNFERYSERLGELPGVRMMPIAAYGSPNYWLSCITVDPGQFGATREDIRLALEAEDIESRPLWKPMHLQPAFAGCRTRGGAVAEALFADGLCLPSGSGLTEADLDRVVAVVRAVHARGGR